MRLFRDPKADQKTVRGYPEISLYRNPYQRYGEFSCRWSYIKRGAVTVYFSLVEFTRRSDHSKKN